MAFDAPEGGAAAFESAAEASGVPLTVVRESYADGREAYGARMVLVRPDQFVAWTGDSAPEDAAAVLHRVTGRE